MAISFELIHPSGLISLRSWTFEKESVIRIGRERDNHIVLHSKVVSRFHAMLWGFGNEWKIVNLSCNGTYVDNAPVTHALLTDGAVIRLAPSGPRVRFRILNNRLTRPPIQNLGTMKSLADDMRESNPSSLKPMISPTELGTLILEPDWEVDEPGRSPSKFSSASQIRR
jgi:pSer/pThr/pTyr-binding forkhead associated (FHA) protein